MHVEECWLSEARALRWRRVDDDTLSGFERSCLDVFSLFEYIGDR